MALQSPTPTPHRGLSYALSHFFLLYSSISFAIFLCTSICLVFCFLFLFFFDFFSFVFCFYNFGFPCLNITKFFICNFFFCTFIIGLEIFIFIIFMLSYRILLCLISFSMFPSHYSPDFNQNFQKLLHIYLLLCACACVCVCL